MRTRADGEVRKGGASSPKGGSLESGSRHDLVCGWIAVAKDREWEGNKAT